MADDIRLVIGVEKSGVLSAITATENLEKKVKKLSDTYARGGISYGKYNRGVEQLAKATKKSKDELLSHGTAIRANAKAVEAAAIAEKQRLKVLREEKVALDQKNKAEAANSAELKRFRISTDQVYAAEQKLLRLKKMLRAEVNAGKMSLRQAATVQMQYKKSLTTMGGGLVQGRNKMSKFGMVSQQVGYQVGDFFVQVQSGQSAMVAFAQQGTQLAGLIPGLGGAIVGIGLSFGAMAYQMLRGKDKAKEAAEGIEGAFSKLPDFFDSLGVDIGQSFDKAFAQVENKYGELFKKLAEIKLKETKASMAESFVSNVSTVEDPSRWEQIKSNVRQMGSTFTEGQDGPSRIQAELTATADAVREIEAAYIASINAAQSMDEIISIVGKTQKDLSAVSEDAAEAFIKQTEEQGIVQAEATAQTKRDEEDLRRARELADAERLAGQSLVDKTRADELERYNGDLAATNATLDAMFKNRTLSFKIRFAGEEKAFGASFTPETNFKPTQSYEELLKMGWTPDNISAMGVDAPKSKTSTKSGGGGKSPQEQLAEFLVKKQEEAALQTQLIGLFGEERDIQSELIKFKQEYGKVASQTQVAEFEATVQQISADKERQKVLEEANAQQQSIADTLQSSMSDAFMSMEDGTKSFEEAMKDMARTVIKQLYDILVVQQLVGSWNATSKTGSGLAGMIMGAFQADGGAWQGGSQIQAYANGGVVGGPTTFPMAGGKTGLMGEAGPEAIMPLKRGANGKLGVQMEGGGGDTIVVNQSFNFQANGDATIKQLIAQAAPKIAQMTKSSLLDDRRRGGSTKAAFG
tara:strand:+ start:132 stop:2555 length:2424 start_codon:yes stop_codon:yes gene_type:complete